MPDIQVRTAVATDLSTLMAIDHSCQTDYVWQLETQIEENQIGAIFREIRLPRSVTVAYPRPVSSLAENWSRRSGVLVAVLGGRAVGYIRANDGIFPRTAWILDLVVTPQFRRQGIARSLVMAVQSWAVERDNQRALLEMPSKNNPAIRFAKNLGYDFCGYNDQYYLTQDIALFFARFIR
jgi:ribosomal protein S18 acetylase RimI-like enzyme